MLNKFRELRALNAFAKKQSVGMQRKLMLYWVSMILVVFAAVILLLSIAGAFSQNDEQLHEVMELQLKNTQDSLASRLDRLTAQSLNLSKELSREIEGELVREGISLQEVNDDPERLLKLQQIMYPLVNTTLPDRQLQRSLCNFKPRPIPPWRWQTTPEAGSTCVTPTSAPAIRLPLPWSTSAVSRISPGKRIWSCTTGGIWNLIPI